jgi:acetyltransferase-like isoleucine patch superfamily enzyme
MSACHVKFLQVLALVNFSITVIKSLRKIPLKEGRFILGNCFRGFKFMVYWFCFCACSEAVHHGKKGLVEENCSLYCG